MLFDRSDFKKLTEERSSAGIKDRLPQMRALAAVAPKMEALTHDENWNTYCGYLAGIKEKLEASRDGAQQRLNSPAVVSHDEMMTQKIALLVNEAQIQIIDLVMELPKVILEGADGARQAIEKFEQLE